MNNAMDNFLQYFQKGGGQGHGGKGTGKAKGVQRSYGRQSPTGGTKAPVPTIRPTLNPNPSAGGGQAPPGQSPQPQQMAPMTFPSNAPTAGPNVK